MEGGGFQVYNETVSKSVNVLFRITPAFATRFMYNRMQGLSPPQGRWRETTRGLRVRRVANRAEAGASSAAGRRTAVRRASTAGVPHASCFNHHTETDLMPVDGKTKGQIEAAVTAAMAQFERDYLGRGPKEARAFIICDMVVVRLTGILTPAEQKVGAEPGGVELIKQMRSRLVEASSNTLKQLVSDATGAEVTTMHTDISSRTGERLFVFGLDRDLEAVLTSS